MQFRKPNKYFYPALFFVLSILIFMTTMLVNEYKETHPDELLNYSNSFEAGDTSLHNEAFYSNRTSFLSDGAKSHSGNNSLCIDSMEKNDARFVYNLKTNKGYYYKVSCWVATENISNNAIGANLSIYSTSTYIGDLRGTNDWTYIEGYIHANNYEDLKICLRLGGFSNENKGKAWFDDLRVEEMEKLPEDLNGATVISMESQPGNKKLEEKNYFVPYATAFLLLSSLLIFIYLAMYKTANEPPFAKGPVFVYIIIVSALAVRVLAAPFAVGFEGDVFLFERWGRTMAEGIPSFYDRAIKETDLADYPPLYMYVLGIVGRICKAFAIELRSTMSIMLVKLPSILADVACGYIIYKFCRKRMKENWSIFFMAAYLFNPMVLMDATLWGQVDSVLILTALCAIYLADNEKFFWSAVMFGCAIMIKPQGIFTGPLLLFIVLKKRSIKAFLQSAAGVLSSIFVICLPYIIYYSFNPSTAILPPPETGGTVVAPEPSLVTGLMFLPNLLAKTAGNYAYASVNGFNLWTLLGLNWAVDKGKTFWGLDYYSWGILLIFVIVIIAGVIYFKGKNSSYKSISYICALILAMGVFDFTVRMHERYMFQAIMLSLIVAILDNSKFMLRVYALISGAAFFNCLVVLAKYNAFVYVHDYTGYYIDYIISAINVVCWVLIVYYAVSRIAGVKGDKLVPQEGLYEQEQE